MMLRTHTCGELRKEHEGETVCLCGWAKKIRTHGNVTFIDLRDRYGITQTVFNEQFKRETDHISRESVLRITGKVVRKPEPNKSLKTGEIEIQTASFELLNKAAPLPMEQEDPDNITEDTRLKYRFLDLRRQDMQESIMLRHRLTKAVRDFFDKEGFLDIETPVLTKSTPEGARDYLVPSRVHQGKFFALPQSPQIFKQLLMVSGFDRYMQIVKCFRDEDLRADRQPEFTQIDIEMSFVTEEDIFSTVDRMLKHVWKSVLNKDVKLPIQKVTYAEAMSRFGTDRPDMRFGMELKDVTSVFTNSLFKVFSETVEANGKIKCITAESFGGASRKEIEALETAAREAGAKGLVTLKVSDDLEGGVAKFLSDKEKSELRKASGAEKGDLLLMVADANHTVVDSALGALRCRLGKELGLYNDGEHCFVWVTDFPLLEWDHDEKRHVAVHHPFTSPKLEDISLLEVDPGKVRARAYDIVLNGVEIGGGSIRIHQPEVQNTVFRLLNISKEEAEMKFGFLLNALKYGAPPHGGIAFGMDRMVMLMAGRDSIREVIAFPKNKNCVSIMDDAPNVVSSAQLDELGIQLKI